MCSAGRSHAHAQARRVYDDLPAVFCFGFCPLPQPRPVLLTLIRNTTATMSFPQTQHMQTHFAPDVYKASHDNLVDPNATPFAPNTQHKSYVLDTSVRPFLPSCGCTNVLIARRPSKRATSMTTTIVT